MKWKPLLWETLEGRSEAGQVRLYVYRHHGTGRILKAIALYRKNSHPSAIWSEIELKHLPRLEDGVPS